MEDPSRSKFSSGFLLGLGGWALSIIPFAIILAYLNSGQSTLWQVLTRNVFEWIFSGALVTGFIWIPFALIAGGISRSRGLKTARTFIVSGFFITLVVVGGCIGLMR
jgi:hypothetical protein